MKSKFAKTKILATLGPSTSSLRKLQSMVDEGLDGVRLNFSHGSYIDHRKIFDLIDKICKKNSIPLAVLQDLQGPKIRIGELKYEKVELYDGEEIELTSKVMEGTEKCLPVRYDHLENEAEIGNKILIDDGLISLLVVDKKKDSIVAQVIEGGTIKPHKGVNFPGMKLSVPSLTEKDYKDLEFGFNYHIDFVALSFVRTPNDIYKLREFLESKNIKRKIIAKIEKKEAVNNFDEIMNIADGIMIARGDLGVEMKAHKVPPIQKSIIRECNAVGKLVITATQMLESMINNPVPTRAEASDVANAVWDGTDVVMLSGETAVGKFPVEAVKVMNDIILTTEEKKELRSVTKFDIPEDLIDNLFDSVGRAVARISLQINAALIVVFTHFGRKARIISKFRPDAPIIAISNSFETMNYLNLIWGIESFFMDNFENEDEAIEKASQILKDNSLVKEGDVIIFTAGSPYGEKGRESWIRFVVY